MSKIRAGSRHPAFYNDEAKARLDAGDLRGALDILDLADKYGCTDKVTASLRANILRRRTSD
jgi:hypothetical protein